MASCMIQHLRALLDALAALEKDMHLHVRAKDFVLFPKGIKRMRPSSAADKPLPVVFACAGCSPVAKLSWEVAKELDRRGVAEMSCLAGVGARRPSFLKQIRDRPVWVVDGCPISCGLGILQLVGRAIDWRIRLDSLGYRKREELASVDVAALVDRLLAVVNKRPVPPYV